MRILLTGSQGFTGVHFTKIATSLGHQVVPLVSDLKDEHAVSREIKGLDYTYVVHLAAISFVGHADDRAFYEVNLFGTLNLLKALLDAKYQPEAVLLASSANVYGNSPFSPISEEVVPSPINHYSMSKLAMEHMARTYGDQLQLILVRPFNYSGPGQSPSFLIPKLVHHFKLRSQLIELGNMDVEREFNDVRMVCDAYIKLLIQGERGTLYNVCSGRPYALREVLNKLAAMTGHHPEYRVNPAFVRSNEVIRLCGDPSRLHTAVSDLSQYTLQDTLSKMFDEERVEGGTD